MSRRTISTLALCLFILATISFSPAQAGWFDDYLAIRSESAELREVYAKLLEKYDGDIESIRQIVEETCDVLYYADKHKAGAPESVLTAYYLSAATDRAGNWTRIEKEIGVDGKPTELQRLAAARQIYYQTKTAKLLDVARRTREFLADEIDNAENRQEIARLDEAIHQSAEALDTAAPIELIEPQDGRDLSVTLDLTVQTDWSTIFSRLAATRRSALFLHPSLAFDRLLINRHEPPSYSHNCDQYLGRHSRPGRGVAILKGWKSKPTIVEPLAEKLPPGDIARPNLSDDATRFVFSFCDHTKDRRFFLYEAAIDGSNLKQLTGTADDPMEGWGGRTTVTIEDFDPCYLPDGGIAFASTRSQNFGRCHGGRYTPSYLLYRCDADGRNIRLISYGEANEHFPSVLSDGRIVFTRWEYINRNQIAFHKLWAIRPDGTGVSNFYGVNTATPWAELYHDRAANSNHWYDDVPEKIAGVIQPYMISETRPIPGSRKVVATGATHHAYTAGAIVVIDPDTGEDGYDPLVRITPEVPYPEAEDYFTVPGAYQSPAATCDSLIFAAYSPFPLRKQRMSVPTGDYSIRLVDRFGGREPIFVSAGESCTTPLPIVSRPAPPVLPSVLTDEDAEKEYGTLIVQNVYLTRNDPEGLIKPGEIKSLRVCEVIAQPHTGAVSAGSREDFARRILGTVPVAADGSVAVKVPAKTPIHLQLLDEHGQAVLTERTLIHVMPGEVRACVGCHEEVGTPPPPRCEALTSPPLELTPPVGPRYEGGLSFMRTVQPVLDRYCIECHGLERTEGDIYLLGQYHGRRSKVNGMPVSPRFDATDSYSSLTTLPGLIKMALRKGNAGPDSETVNSRPGDYFARASKLAPMLLAGHEKIKLDGESMQRVIDWLDMNAIRYGDYGRTKPEWRRIDGAAEPAIRAMIKDLFGDRFADDPINALVNVGQIDESRILKAPLAKEAGGWGQVKGWRSTEEESYQKLKALIEASLR